MKAIYPIIILAGALSSLAPSISPPDLGPVEVNVRGTCQNLRNQTISGRTNVVGGTTNFTYALKSTTTNITINTDGLLALLENSFNTNFPAGCRLLLVEQTPYCFFYVSDVTGTNLGFNPYPILSTAFLNDGSFVSTAVESGTTTNSGGSLMTGKDAATFTAALSFTYDDSSLTNVVDHTHTQFTWVGLAHDKLSLNISNGLASDNVTMEITGGGSIRGQDSAVFSGSIRAKTSGFDK